MGFTLCLFISNGREKGRREGMLVFSKIGRCRAGLRIGREGGGRVFMSRGERAGDGSRDVLFMCAR